MMFLSSIPSSSSTPIPLVKRNKSCPDSHTPLKFRIKNSTSSKSRSKKRVAISGFESRVSLVLALANQTQRLFMELAIETAKYVFPNTRFQTTTLEEVFMSVPNLETVQFKVLNRNTQYEIRQVQSYFIAETTMPGKNGFEFVGASQSFNTLAEYLFGKNTGEKQMEMTTPVFTRKMEPKGEKMDMTTPVITTRVKDDRKWTMSFVLPSKYGANLPLPKNSSVTIREVPNKIIAVVAFSGFVTDEEVKSRESALRKLLMNDSQFRVKENAPVEIAQYNPPFTPPFQRRNEIALEVERRQI